MELDLTGSRDRVRLTGALNDPPALLLTPAAARTLGKALRDQGEAETTAEVPLKLTALTTEAHDFANALIRLAAEADEPRPFGFRFRSEIGDKTT